MKTQHYLINPIFAKKENLPTSFVATALTETQRAVFMYGHGKMDPAGSCARCGRTLTHPGSILIGIGPECLGDWGARDIKLDNMSESDKVHLKSLLEDRKVDCWIPKSVIKQTLPTDEQIDIPKDHRMLIAKKEVVSSKKAREWKGRIAIQFPYSAEMVSKVKTLDGRTYHPDKKYWTCPIHVDNISNLKEWGFSIDEQLDKLLEKSQVSIEEVKKEISLAGLNLKKQLFPFQEDGVKFLEAKEGRALIADEMGLGKTIQSLAYLQLHPEQRPAVIVCPSSLKLNWIREICSTMTGPHSAQTLEGRQPYSTRAEILIINYDILQYWVKNLKEKNPQIIIADECHLFKSNSAKRTKAMKLLAKGVPHFIALSGTPIVNRPVEIYNALSMIDSTIVPSFWKYAERYCGAKHNGYGWDFSGATNTEELHEVLTKSVMIRRKKSDVLKDLPNKMYSLIPFRIDNPQEYNSIEENFIDHVRSVRGEEAAEKASNSEILAQIEYLKQAAVKGKMKSVIEWIRDFLDTDGKLVVFAVHRFVIDQIMEEFKGISVKIDGGVSPHDRDKAVQLFQTNDDIRLFVGNIRAAGVGLTLTASSNVAFIELPWTPGDLAQAEDRCHRIGQKDSVNVYYLLADQTIEWDIANLLDKKRKVLDSVLDGQQPSQESLLGELIKITTEKPRLI